jgi:hypothetical protein
MMLWHNNRPCVSSNIDQLRKVTCDVFEVLASPLYYYLSVEKEKRKRKREKKKKK